MSYKEKALQEIKKTSGNSLGAEEIDLFISHHIDELPNSYWQKHLGADNPSSGQVLEMLVFRSKWVDEEVYDFTLPEEVTNYVVSVSFSEDGNIEDIVMES